MLQNELIMFRSKPYCLAAAHLVPSLSKHMEMGKICFLVGQQSWISSKHWNVFNKESNCNIL